MINAAAEPFELYEVIISKDELGCDILTYKLVCEIPVTVSKEHKRNVTQDGLDVNTATYKGVTRFTGLETCKSYVIRNEKANYKVLGVINGRWSQLQLEVVCYE